MKVVLSRLLVMGILASALMSCTTVRGWLGQGGRTAPADSAALSPVDPEQAKQDLETIVEAYAVSQNNSAAGMHDQVQREKPYFFKEYVEYPAGATNGLEPVLQETESLTAPYRAEVSLPKVRYATRLHRNREDARLDSIFYRQTGTETLSYSLRNGSWHRLGGVFVAEKTETLQEGTWTETTPSTVPVSLASDTSKGYFSRLWSRWFGN